MEARTDMERELETITRNYLDAVGKKELHRLETLLAPDVTFVGPVMSIRGVPEVTGALRRIGAVMCATT